MAAVCPYGFVIPLADEGVVQLEACLGFLRAAYPDAPAVVVSDGVADPAYDDCCRRHRVDYKLGAYLKRIECGGAWWRRTLEAGVALGTKWLVKLDPDARVWRPFASEPLWPIAGTVENPGTEHENVQGGCQAIRADAARTLLAAGRFDDWALRSEWTFRVDERTRRQRRAMAYMSTDATLMWLARHAGVACGGWPEVGSNWLVPPPNADAAFAVTHPHKLEPAFRFPDAPLHVVTTCKGRLGHLKETLPTWCEPGVTITVVDYGCPDRARDWVRRECPQARVVAVAGVPHFNLAHARNLGAAAAADADWLCFFDADWRCAPGWSEAVRASLRAGRYLLADPIQWSQFGSVVVRRADYLAAGGYDELIKGWGAEDGDFYSRLRQVGVRPGSFPGRMFSSIQHDDASRTKHYENRDKQATQRVSDTYHAAKVRWMLATGRLPRPDEARALLDDAYRTTGVPRPASFYPTDAAAPAVVVHPPRAEEGATVETAVPPAETPAAAITAAAAPGLSLVIHNHGGSVHLNVIHSPADAVTLGHSANASGPAHLHPRTGDEAARA